MSPVRSDSAPSASSEWNTAALLQRFTWQVDPNSVMNDNAPGRADVEQHTSDRQPGSRGAPGDESPTSAAVVAASSPLHGMIRLTAWARTTIVSAAARSAASPPRACRADHSLHNYTRGSSGTPRHRRRHRGRRCSPRHRHAGQERHERHTIESLVMVGAGPRHARQSRLHDGRCHPHRGGRAGRL